MYSPLRFKIWLRHITYCSTPNLYARIARGDARAFAQFCDIYYSATYNAIARLANLHSPSELELLTNSVFLHLWSNKFFFSGKAQIGSFLFRTTLTTVLQFLANNNDVDRIALLQYIINCDQPFQILKTS